LSLALLSVRQSKSLLINTKAAIPKVAQEESKQEPLSVVPKEPIQPVKGAVE
jgi:hypothetical protein